MKIKIESTKCIGCGSCAQIAPEVFEIVNGVSVVKKDAPLDDPEVQERVKMAAAACPLAAITIEE